MIVYIKKNPRNLQNPPLELIRGVSKIPGYKVNTQN